MVCSIYVDDEIGGASADACWSNLQGTGGRYFFPLFTHSKNLRAFNHLIGIGEAEGFVSRSICYNESQVEEKANEEVEEKTSKDEAKIQVVAVLARQAIN
ncbi:hypothetical protein NC651_002837 [Populus alba x Populus x berolinensis]|nr:hypothetical protein NC651_002837 [Populus alba x Populus x berolinensis]